MESQNTTDSFERETPRLLLRRWRDADRAPFAVHNADPEVMRYFAARLTSEENDAVVDRILAHWDQHGWGPWAAERCDTGEFIGFLGLLVPRFPLPGNPPVEVGWRLGRAHWGQGYATEGAQAALELGFGPLGLQEIVAVTALGNERSKAVMRRLGLRDAQLEFDHPGVPEESAVRRHCMYRIERADWESRPRRRDARSAAAGPSRGWLAR
ncbi:MAG TPA: GNAT family N-acetyltransferase [Planctomycetota bacterium]|nr:GNAT family N-acetyltransferase [Planctomycetota bacterium]